MIVDQRRLVRWLVRVVALGVLASVVYVATVFVQVVWSSGRDEARPAEAIVVLGAAQYDGEPSPALARRLDHAFDLWDRGLSRLIVVTGGRREGDRFTEAAASANYLIRLGVPDAAIRREVDGTNTWESLAAAARFLDDEGIHDVLLVSDDYHVRRVAEIARELGMTVAVSPTDSGLSTAGKIRAMVRETAAVSVGRLIGYRRLMRVDDAVESRND